MSGHSFGRWLLAAAFILSTFFIGSTVSTARAQGAAEMLPPGVVTTGKLQYRRYCASCHGTDAKGNGPVAAALTKKPSDLTVLAKDNKGVFPEEKLVKVIEGTSVVEAHGTREMPVWGFAFMRARPKAPTSPPLSPLEIQQRIKAIVGYLQSIQEK
jgi:mono/diheme cytochrome c family protein